MTNPSMQLEFRYYIVKRKDVEEFFTPTEREIFDALMRKIIVKRCEQKRGHIRAVLVEHDWPMFESVCQQVLDYAKTES